MANRKKGKNTLKAWYNDLSVVADFERDAIEEYPSLVSCNRMIGSRRWRQYILTVNLLEYDAREVKIKFNSDSKLPPRVTVDGPCESAHRYKGGALCMWYPKDLDEKKWIFSDGLLELLVMIEFHLYREAWWRETGEWPGPEVPH